MLPNFLCVGFRKCGTSTLQQILVSNPQIYLPEIKETHFFSIRKELKKGIDYYENKYYSIPEGQYKAVGGIEPTWMSSANEIAKYFPKETKFIFIMRNPVEYCYSIWKMYTRQGRIRYSIRMPFNNPQQSFKIDVEEELAKKRNYLRGYFRLRDAKYIHFIYQFLKYYPKENMKFIIFEEFIKNKKDYIDDICNFLDINKMPFIQENTHANIGNTVACNKLANWLLFFIRNIEDNIIPYMNNDYLNKSNFYNYLVEKFSITTKQHIDFKTRQDLELYFSKSVRKLELFLHKDLSTLWYESKKYL